MGSATNRSRPSCLALAASGQEHTPAVFSASGVSDSAAWNIPYRKGWTLKICAGRGLLDTGTTDRRRAVKYFLAAVRLSVALLGTVAILSTFFDTATRATINPFNFFGFFTMQSNIILVVVLLVAAVVSLSGRRQPGR